MRAAQAAAQKAADVQAEPAPVERGSYLLHVGRQAMACEFEVLVNAGQPPNGPDVALRALDLVDALEDQLSVYRPHSEISRINACAAEGPVEVEERLFALLNQALDLYRVTEGAFDITSGPLSKVWGFYRREGRVPTDVEIATTLERVGSKWVELDAQRRTITFRRPGVELNLGAIGKGHALDRGADLMVRDGVQDFLIHGGTSSILGRGSRGGLPEGQSGWSVALRHPMRPEKRLAEIWLRDRALGTSGAGYQYFFHQGRRYGHILDPRTGHPAEAVLASTVVAPTAAEADALATAFYVGGLETAQRYCAERPEVSAILITAATKAGRIQIHPFNLTEQDWSNLAADE